MARNGKERELAVWPETVVGGKYVRLLERQLRQLRSDDAHGNRRLFLDDVFVAYLLAFFNPTIRSLRTIEDFSASLQAQRHLSVQKICRSTLSDFNRLVEPERLEPILAALRSRLSRQQASQPGRRDEDLSALLGARWPLTALFWRQLRTLPGLYRPIISETRDDLARGSTCTYRSIPGCPR